MFRRTLVSFPLGIVLIISLLLGAFTGCGGRDEDSGDSAPGTQPQRAAVVGMLELMPESAVTAFATPSVRELGESVEDFLLRASPDSINMEAEIRVVIQQMGRAVGVPDARSLDDIAFENSIDPARPVALFLAANLEEHVEGGDGEIESGDEQDMPSAEINFPSAAGQSIDGFAVAAYVLDPDDAEQAVRRLLGGAEFVDESASANDVGMHVTQDSEWCYFIHDGILVVGTYPIVSKVPARFRAPAPVRYDSGDCPSDPTDRLIQLTRLDRLTSADALVHGQMEEELPSDLSGAVSDVLQDVQTLFQGDDPLICVYRVTDESVDVLTRLDRNRYPALADWRGPARGLPHLALLPEDTVSVVTWEFDGTLRELTTNAIKSALAAETAAEGAPASMGDSLETLVEQLRGEITIAVAKPNSGDPAILVLADVADGDIARTQLRAAGLMPLVSETYNGTDICLLPLPVPVGDRVCYALPGDTMVLSTNPGRLKTTMDLLDSTRSTNWAARQNPAMNPQDPLFTALLIKPNPLSEALVPQLESQDAIDSGDVATAQLAWEHIREVRLITRVNGIWQETHLRVVAE